MASDASAPLASLAVALAHAEKLLVARPSLAEAQAREILKVAPSEARALALLGEALGAQGRGDAAVEALRAAVAGDPAAPRAWQALGDQLTLAGDAAGADQAYAAHIRASVHDPELLSAATALCEGRLAVAERSLKAFLKTRPTDVAAIRMLAEVAARLGRYEDAETLLARCLDLAPSFEAARHNYAVVLYRQNKASGTMAQVETLLGAAPANPNYRNLKAAALGQIGAYGEAIEIYEDLLATHPAQPKGWMSYGHVLKTVGRTVEAIAAYRRSLALAPNLGEAWWSLANLKTHRFTSADVAAMNAGLEAAEITREDRFHLHFALGKAREDDRDFAGAFTHFQTGNSLRRADLGWDARAHTELTQRTMATFTQAFFDERRGVGADAPAPIFVVGLPRSGSTLIEQILASHSAVEGTMELPDITAIAKMLGGRRGIADRSLYPEMLKDLTADEFRVLGEDYLERTQVHRRLGRPHFIDKMPNNFMHVGLISLILPRATIIDARRHPMGCGMANFKQHFARGQAFTYDLADVGAYWRDYAALMAHFDQVLPGRIYRVVHERLVADPEAEIRRLLDHCRLPFEPNCLNFHQTERAVRTASSEQVRRPLTAEGVDAWRAYEQWLTPMRAALERPFPEVH